MEQDAVNNLDASVTLLERRTQSLAVSLTSVEKALRRRTMILGGLLALIAIILMSTVPAMVIVSLDNREAIAQNNAKFCPLITPFIPAPGEPGPVTANGRRITEAMKGLAGDPSFRCFTP